MVVARASVGRGHPRAGIASVLVAATCITGTIGSVSHATAARGGSPHGRATRIVGRNVFQVSGSRQFIIDVTRPTTLAANETSSASKPARSVQVKGAGRFAGIVITEDPPRDNVPLFVAAEFTICRLDPCRQSESSTVVATRAGGRSMRLRPGRYRAYVVTDGAAEVTLNVRGLTGTTTLVDGERANVTAEEMTPWGVSLPGSYAASTSYAWDRSSLLLSSLWVRSATAVGPVAYGHCNYEGKPDPPPPVADSPGCHLYDHAGLGNAIGSEATVYNPPAGPPQERLLQFSTLTVPDLPQGATLNHGLWATTTGTVDDAGAMAVLLRYN